MSDNGRNSIESKIACNSFFVDTYMAMAMLTNFQDQILMTYIARLIFDKVQSCIISHCTIIYLITYFVLRLHTN